MALIDKYLTDAHKLLRYKSDALDMLYNEIETKGDIDEIIETDQYQHLKKNIDSYENEIKFLQKLINLCNQFK